MTQFVELNNAMGVQKEDVGVIIANVRNVIAEDAKAFRNFARGLESQCTASTARIRSSIQDLTNKIRDALSNIANWQKNLNTAQADVKDAQLNIVKGRQQLVQLQQRQNKVSLDFEVYTTEADKKLNVVKVLRDIITDELLNRSPGALVQVNKFQAKLAELKGLLNNNSDSLYSPMIGVLLDLATEQNFSDQSVLRKILQNLKNLDAALKSFRAKQDASYTAEMKGFTKQVENVSQRVNAYHKMKQQAYSKVLDASNYINFYNNEKNHYTAEKKREEDGLALFVKLCEFEKKVHKTLRDNYNLFKRQVSNLFSNVQQLN